MKLKWVELDGAWQLVLKWARFEVRGADWILKWVEIILELEPGS